MKLPPGQQATRFSDTHTRAHTLHIPRISAVQMDEERAALQEEKERLEAELARFSCVSSARH